MNGVLGPAGAGSGVLPPDGAALLGDAWLAVRRRLRSALARYFSARTEAERVADAVNHVESDTYATVARWLCRGSVDPAELWRPAVWIGAARELAPRYFQSLRPVVNGCPVQPLGTLADSVAERLPAPVSDLDPAELLQGLCDAYGPDAPAWVAEVLASLLFMPQATHRDRAASLGVDFEAYRTRLRRIRAALCAA